MALTPSCGSHIGFSAKKVTKGQAEFVCDGLLLFFCLVFLVFFWWVVVVVVVVVVSSLCLYLTPCQIKQKTKNKKIKIKIVSKLTILLDMTIVLLSYTGSRLDISC